MKEVIGACSIVLALTAAPLAWAQTPAGAEFLVNTYTPGRQWYARAAMEPDGDFVVAWQSFAQDGNGYGVFGQRFGASGIPRGSEFAVNTYTTGSQDLPHVAVASDGSFVVVWGSVQDGSTGSIHCQRYDASGGAIGGEFSVNTFTIGRQYRPHVGLGSDGRFVVSWTSQAVDGNSFGIAARRFDASGIPIGDEFVVNTYTTGVQVFGDLAVEANGNFVVVWEDFFNGRDGSGSAIFGQRYDGSNNRVGSEFQVNSYTTGNQRFASVSVSPAGGFVVAWSGPDGSDYGMFSRLFDASGNAVGDDFAVNTHTTSGQYGLFGQVAHDAQGNFVVTWTSYRQDGNAAGAFAQRFDASGSRRGSESRVNAYTPGNQMLSSVVSDAGGNFVVVWDSRDGQDGSSSGIFGQRYDGDLIFEDGFDSGGLSP